MHDTTHIPMGVRIAPYLCALLAIVTLLSASFAHAATIEFSSEQMKVGEGSVIDVPVFLTTEEAINAVEIDVRIPEEFEYISVADGSSIVSFWVDQPSYRARSRTVSFAGIIPGGFAGERGKIVEIRLRTPRATSQVLTVADTSTVFAHGPNGVRTGVRAVPLTIIVERGMAPETGALDDAQAPEPFTPAISQDPALFEGRPFVTFATHDKGSGIDRYEIQERSIDMPIDGAWRAVESPALLEDAERNSYVFVRAIDRAGNVRMAIIPPLRESSFLGVVLGLLFAVLAIALLFTVYNRGYRYADAKRDS